MQPVNSPPRRSNRKKPKIVRSSEENHDVQAEIASHVHKSEERILKALGHLQVQQNKADRSDHVAVTQPDTLSILKQLLKEKEKDHGPDTMCILEQFLEREKERNHIERIMNLQHEFTFRFVQELRDAFKN